MSSTQPVPYPLRMPDSLRTRLGERAKANGRSLNAEILGILQSAVDNPLSGLSDVDAFAEDLANRLAAKLKVG
jgi:plasmid stability protein